MDMRIVEKFIERNIGLIDDYNFKELYEKALSAESGFGLHYELIGKLSEILLSCDINPLLYVEKVPIGYLFGSTEIKTLVLPSNIRLIGELAFENSKIESIHLPDSLFEIGEHAFTRCDELRYVNINDYYNFFNLLMHKQGQNPLAQLFHKPNLIINGTNILTMGYTVNIHQDRDISGNILYYMTVEKINQHIDIYYPQPIKIYDPSIYITSPDNYVIPIINNSIEE